MPTNAKLKPMYLHQYLRWSCPWRCLVVSFLLVSLVFWPHGIRCKGSTGASPFVGFGSLAVETSLCSQRETRPSTAKRTRCQTALWKDCAGYPDSWQSFQDTYSRYLISVDHDLPTYIYLPHSPRSVWIPWTPPGLWPPSGCCGRLCTFASPRRVGTRVHGSTWSRSRRYFPFESSNQHGHVMLAQRPPLGPSENRTTRKTMAPWKWESRPVTDRFPQLQSFHMCWLFFFCSMNNGEYGAPARRT